MGKKKELKQKKQEMNSDKTISLVMFLSLSVSNSQNRTVSIKFCKIENEIKNEIR